MQEKLKFLIDNNPTIQQCNALPEIEKWRIYFEYVASQYSLKHSFSIRIEDEKNYLPINHKAPDKVFLGLHFRYLWAHIPEPVSFTEFCSNITHVVIGKNWQAQGYAAESWIEYPLDSIYYWVSRYKCNTKPAIPRSQVVLNPIPTAEHNTYHEPAKASNLDFIKHKIKAVRDWVSYFILGDYIFISVGNGMYQMKRTGGIFQKLKFS